MTWPPPASPRRARVRWLGRLASVWSGRRAALAPPFVRDPEQVTSAGPHVRDRLDLRGMTRRWLVALAPCALAGAWGVGHHVLAALGQAGVPLTSGGGAGVLTILDLPVDPHSIAACLAVGTVRLAPALAVAWLVGLAWVVLFARLRRRPRSEGVVLTALTVVLLVPPTLPLWQLALAVSFGVVFAQEVFGGPGRQVVHPAVAAVAFLVFAYPGQARGDDVWIPVEGVVAARPVAVAASGGAEALAAAGIDGATLLAGPLVGPPGAASALACLLGAALLIGWQLVSWRTLAGGLAGLLAAALVAAPLSATPMGSVPWWWHPALGSFAFVLVFLAADPVTSSHTPAGRWVHGVLVGALTMLLRLAHPVHVEGALLAVLLGHVLAPLVDRIVVELAARRRRARLG